MADSPPFTPNVELCKKNEYFKLLIGITEKEFLLQRNKFIIEAEKPVDGNADLGTHLLLKSADGTIYDAGAFKSWSLQELHNAFSTSLDQVESKESKCIFEIHTRHSANSFAKVEVSALQASSDPNGKTLYQVASNFNCCENASPFLKLNSGQYLTSLVLDDTQGPSSTTSAMAATITRVHGAFYDPHIPHTQWGQTEKRMVENFSNEIVKDHFPMFNGKALCIASRENWPSDPLEHSKMLQYAKVGLHCGISAQYARCILGKPSCSKYQLYRVLDSPKFDQVFVSALDIHEAGIIKLTAEERLSKIRFILNVAYRGTYAAAAMRQSQTLVLTCVGGGAFGNNLSDIATSIAEAHVAYQFKCKNLKKVILPLFKIDADVKVFKEALEKVGAKVVVVQHT